MQKRRKHLRGWKRRSFQRRLRWFGAWSVLILALVLTGGLVIGIVTGVKNVCETYLQEHGKKENGQVAMISTNRNVKTDRVLQQEEEQRTEEGEAGAKELDEAFKLQEEDVSNTQNPAVTLLVNKSVYLSTDYEVALTTLKNGQQVADIIYEDLKAMLTEGEKEMNISFLVSSGYRTAEKQKQLLEEEIQKNMTAGMEEKEARADALLTVAPAHFSEHETGLAVDIVSVTNQRLDDTQELTAANRWLRENCHKYGFILRYPKGKEEITGFSYESWHFRYVGKEAAKEIMGQGITLEEYLDKDKD